MFLHGTLEATIFHAKATTTSPFPFNCLFACDKQMYVTISLDDTRVAETTHEDDRSWNQTFRILCAHSIDTVVTITIRTVLTVLGKIQIPGRSLVSEESKDLRNGSHPLLNEKGKPVSNLDLRFMLRFTNAESETYWGKGLGQGDFRGIAKGVSFPQRSNCRVTLYQDAHHSNSFHPPLFLQGGETYRPGKLWEDVYKAIDGAKHLVYIAGWSFNPNMVLVRDPRTEIKGARGVTIGELLKRKAKEGVAVRVMLWDDETSLPVIKNKGVMRTHDEDAFDYFKRTKVICRLCPRLHHRFPTLFAHHQKTITVDSRRGVKEDVTDREIVSFVGGLDVCGGRYDTEQHSLFRTLNTESHVNDFYQISFTGASLHKGGPREPWHDTHACIAGAAARDVLSNFEDRWSRQCDSSSLLDKNTIPDQFINSNAHSENSDWNVQVFRSIDNISAHLPNNLHVEHSIHDAYVEAIRRAERFIYIENQYFLGGCHMWDVDKSSGCKNLIPIEIALKVASKIRVKERFAVYIVIPMWPEGVPESEPVQDILHWTRLTMRVMYRLISMVIKDCGANAHPRDYLNFFCLANREIHVRGEFVPPDSPQRLTLYWRAQKNRRFMIYVHSKLMIVDDEYILIGSANVNQRSMDGRRDTEIAIGCYKPNHIGDARRSGGIHAYRMSLWYEHMRQTDVVFLEPESEDCVRRVVELGEEMWRLYSGDEVVDMEGVHLVNYPISVMEDGSVEDLPQSDGAFPDTRTPVKGRRSKFLPPVCTT
ncbi:Phospholipase D epsilon [Acorus calamus]|uniref:Phospholipase D n=1 Tax=Acorus calamus TaxID=4465 RepID=A0AAV9EWD0_ACOCL|nr:Phospholipase D epsilon [Acorus calamus]